MLRKYLPFLKKEESIDPRLLVFPQKYGEYDVLYPTISRRIYAISLDIMILSIITYPLIKFILWFFKDSFEVVKRGQGIILEYLQVQNPSVSMIFEALNDQRMIDMGFMNQYLISQLVTQGSLLVVSIAFLAWFNYKYATSPGKWVFGLRVLDSKSYSTPSLFQSIIRNVASILTVITLIIPMAFARFELRHRALHDFIARTVVVRIKKPKNPSFINTTHQ